MYINFFEGESSMSSKAPVLIGFEDAEIIILLESLLSFSQSADEGNKTEIRDLRKRIVAALTGEGL